MGLDLRVSRPRFWFGALIRPTVKRGWPAKRLAASLIARHILLRCVTDAMGGNQPCCRLAHCCNLIENSAASRPGTENGAGDSRSIPIQVESLMLHTMTAALSGACRLCVQAQHTSSRQFVIRVARNGHPDGCFETDATNHGESSPTRSFMQDWSHCFGSFLSFLNVWQPVPE